MKYAIVICILYCFHYFDNSLTPKTLHEHFDTLKVGDKAPPLTIIKWLKGNAIDSFAKGNIYVIEFGFAACTPCRASIPHLTELASRYRGKIKIISVHIWENDKDNLSDLSYILKVEQFVKQQRKKIGYTVAVDVPNQTTATDWNGAAPKSFVVGRDGTIKWIGHPDDLDSVVELVVANSFDSQRADSIENANKNYIDSQFVAIYKFKEAGNYSRSIGIVDSLIAKYPSYTSLYYDEYKVLEGMDLDNRRADSVVRLLLRNKPKGFTSMYYLANDLVQRKYPNCDLAIEMANWALKESTYDFSSAFILNCKAYAYYKKGNLSKAIETQNRAIAYIKPTSTAMIQAKKNLETRLIFYMAKLRPSGHLNTDESR